MANGRGIIKVESDHGRLRLGLPSKLSQHVYGKPGKKIYLNLIDLPENRKFASAKAQLMNADLALDRFDTTLERYHLGNFRFKSIEPVTTKDTELPSNLLELWKQYREYKSNNLKPKSLCELDAIGKLIARVSRECNSNDALAVRRELLELTTNHQTKKALIHISACYEWALKHSLRSGINPYKGMSSDLPKFNYQDNAKPNPFTEEEKQTIINDFQSSVYYRYVPFVRFLFLTGCRPSEAIGLRWCDISDDWNHIEFNGSIVTINGEAIRNEGSKNNKKRKFPINEELKRLLWLFPDSETYHNKKPDDLVFLSPKGKPINYNNFSRRAWNAIVDPIKSGTTPYCCRDTFISEQIAKGVAIAVIAKWCDTSTQMIEKHYLGDRALEGIKPL